MIIGWKKHRMAPLPNASKPNSPPENGVSDEALNAVLYREAVDRARLLSYIFGPLYTLYGVTSYAFIREFSPRGLSLWENVWPRVLVNLVPFLALGAAFRSPTKFPKRRLVLWSVAFALLTHAAAWIRVWPIALAGRPEILPYIHGPNLFLIIAAYAGLGLPFRFVGTFTLIFATLFLVPLFVVARTAGNPVIFNLIVNDSLLAVGVGIVLSKIIDDLRTRVARAKMEKEGQAMQFLGPILSRAIFNEEKERLRDVRCTGFILTIDIRDSTKLQREHPEAWASYTHAYFAVTARTVAKHGGYIQRTSGDGHVINFGVMDYGVDLTDIPGIEVEAWRAEERRISRASVQAFAFIEELFPVVEALARAKIPSGSLHLGAGIDKGEVQRSVHGDIAYNLELDVSGEAVNCSNRLQEYSKHLRLKGWEGSILVVSPFAADYLPEGAGFTRISTAETGVRDYPDIRWVLARSYFASELPNAR